MLDLDLSWEKKFHSCSINQVVFDVYLHYAQYLVDLSRPSFCVDTNYL